MQIFDELYITLNKILGECANILLVGHRNNDGLKPGWNSSNPLSDAKGVLNLTNLI